MDLKQTNVMSYMYNDKSMFLFSFFTVVLFDLRLDTVATLPKGRSEVYEIQMVCDKVTSLTYQIFNSANLLFKF